MLNTLPTIGYMVVWMTQNWFLVAVAGPLGFLIATWGGILGLSFGPVRNLFAFSFDGLLPGWFNKVARNGSPNRAVLLAFLISWAILTISVFTTWWSFITYTVTIWMVGWVLLGIAAMVFPYVRKDIFEKSPAARAVESAGRAVDHHPGDHRDHRRCGQPLRDLPRGHDPDVQHEEPCLTSLFFILAPIVIYIIMNIYQRSKGVRMDLRFKTVPPD